MSHKETYIGEFKTKKEVGKNLFKTYEVNGKQYIDNIPKNISICISKEQYIEYEQQKEENKRLNNIINELEEWVNNIMFTQGTYCINCMQVLNKIKKLKDSDKSE